MRGAGIRGRGAAAALTAAVLATLAGCATLRPEADRVDSGSLLRVNVTRQGYAPRRPWEPLPVQRAAAVGVALDGGRVLVRGGPLADHRYIELETVEGARRSPARLLAVDYEADLALLAPVDETFAAGLRPVALAREALPGDRLTVPQVKPSGGIVAGAATVTAVELAAYPYGDHFLVYRLRGALQHRYDNATLPVLRGGRLAGLLKRDGSGDQTLDVIPVPVVARFLADAADGDYRGFPRLGIRFASTDDPALRRYAGLPGGAGGVFIEHVVDGGSAAAAGLRAGDVLTAIDGHPVDSRGYYEDPRYGRLGIAHLIRCGLPADRPARLTLWRRDRAVTLTVDLDRRRAADDLVPAHHNDRPPGYYVLGGLVLQELDRPYLEDFGQDWRLQAPIHLVYLHDRQHDRPRMPGERVVLLNSVLPTPATVGYEGLNNVVVPRINGRPIRRLADVPAALARPLEGFHAIDLDQPPFRIYLDPGQIGAIDRQVRERYHLPALQRLTGGE